MPPFPYIEVNTMPLITEEGSALSKDEAIPLVGAEEQTETTTATKRIAPILVEIIGATNLVHPSKADEATLLHPFVLAKLHGRGETQILHRTKRIKNTKNPIWCVEHRCLFLFDASTVIEGQDDVHTLPSVVEFDIRHKDKVDPMSCTQLGSASIDIKALLRNCTEERIELKLEQRRPERASILFTRDQTPSSKEMFQPNSDSNTVQSQGKVNGAKIALRFRPASELDIKLIGELKNMEENGQYSSFHCDEHAFINSDGDLSSDMGKVEFITERNQADVLGGYSNVVNRLNFTFRKSRTDTDGIVRHKVKPYPDPQRLEATEYLSHDEMVAEIIKPSTNWIAAGKETSQSLGKVYLEILKCDNLPNMDIGEGLGNKTDAFVCAIFEDAMVQTDVIDDKLSPFWFPWSQRAFVFQMTYPLSPLFISVNDFDIGPSGHDGIGRIAINLSHFKSDTMYTLRYNLYPASNIPERERLGTITIRLRKEIADEKKLLMASLEPAPRFHVNMKKRMTHPVANFTCFGIHNEDKYDVKLLRSYVNEMLELKRFTAYAVKDALTSLIMWHGQLQFGRVNLPIHSAIAFFGGIFVIERPHLLPGCFFLSIAWIMLASLNSRTHHPSPWHRALPFSYYMSLLLFGKSFLSPEDIKSMECHKETVKYETNWDTRIKTDLDAINKRWELQLEMDKIGNEDLQTEEKTKSADPLVIALASLESRLYPMQKRLRGYCESLRYVKKILTWEEGMLSFWVTLPCLVIGIVLLILPTVFLIHWICRIFIWLCFGPWLRIYYEFFVWENKVENALYLHNDKSRNEYAENIFQTITDQFQEIERVARMKGEDAIKMKSMRMLRFGQFIAKVPSMNITRNYDYPLSESKASHISLVHEEVDLNRLSSSRIVPSQRLEGQMIPMTEEQLLVYEENSRVTEFMDANEDNCDATPKERREEKETVPTSISQVKKPKPLPISTTFETENTEEDDDDVGPQKYQNPRLWLNKTVSQFGTFSPVSQISTLSFSSRLKVAAPAEKSTKSGDDGSEEIPEKSIEIDDKVLHISTNNILPDGGDDDDTDDSHYQSGMDGEDEDLRLKTPTHSSFDEEGVEIVAWDDTSEMSEDVRDDHFDDADSVASSTYTAYSDASRLSAVFKSTDSVYMAFCRTGSVSNMNTSENADLKEK